MEETVKKTPPKLAQLTVKQSNKETNFSLFCILWALAILFHQAIDSINSPIKIVVTIAAIGVLVFPRSLILLTLLLTTQICCAYFDGFLIGNQWLYVAFVNQILLICIVYLLIKHRKFAIDRAQLFRVFRLPVQILLVMVYFFAVLSKLNIDYFNPEVSCASQLYFGLANILALPRSNSFAVFAIYATLIIELLIPIFLLTKKTRVWGILLGICFHFIIGFFPPGMYHWSIAALVSYYLFLPEEVTILLSTRFFPVFYRVVIVMTCLSMVDSSGMVSKLFFACITIGAIILVLKNREMIFRTPLTFDNTTPAFLFFFPVLFLLNALSPYLGLKSRSSFAMFSNLRTEGGRTNHFFIPISIQLFSQQRNSPIPPVQTCP